MDNKLEDPPPFKIGDEIWWFQVNCPNGGVSYGYQRALNPGQLHLVHDHIREIQDDILVCWHCAKRVDEIWGKSRQDAWDTLKRETEKWGAIE